jgi:hypothetical protein
VYIRGIPARPCDVLLEELPTLEDRWSKVRQCEEDEEDEDAPNLREVFTQ